MSLGKIKKFIPWLISLTLLLLVVVNYQGFLSLGGEGNYFLNFQAVKDLYRHSWVDFNGGVGDSALLYNFSAVIFDFFSLLQTVGLSAHIISIVYVFLLYFLPFIAMYLLLSYFLKLNFKTSLLISLFYILNPFSMVHFDGQLFWNIVPMFVMPITFGIIYKYFYQPLKLFVYFGLFTLLFCFSFANIPYLGVFHIFLVISLFLIPLLQKNKFDFKRMAFNFIILELSFFLYNFWWLFPMIRATMFSADVGYAKDFATGWTDLASQRHSMLTQIFSLRPLTSFNANEGSFFSIFYNNFFVKTILFIPLAIILYFYASLLKNKEKKYTLGVLPLTLLISLLVVIFLNKGMSQPWGQVYLFLMKHVPLFYIFKSPWEKFGILLIFLVALSLAVLIPKMTGERVKKIAYYLVGSYLAVCSLPLLTFNFNPDYRIGPDQYVSKKYIDKPEYQAARNFLNSDLLNYRILTLPGAVNYQVTMANHGNNYYRGLDPNLFAINKQSIAIWWGEQYDFIYENLSNDNLGKILSLFNVKKIMINNDIYPIFGSTEKETLSQLKEQFSRSLPYYKAGPIDFFDNNYFLPRLYVPENIIKNTDGDSSENLWNAVSGPKYNISSVIFLKQDSKEKDFLVSRLPGEVKSKPTVEFKKINPAKYRIVVHGAKESFPLVFLEKFHRDWKVYLEDYKNTPVNSQENFISEDTLGTRQNENLEKGFFWEVYPQKPLVDENNHLIANSYANSWWINLADVKKTGKYFSNPDGSIDFEIVLEFWQERVLYFGLAVSGLAVLLSVLLLIIITIKNRLLR